MTSCSEFSGEICQKALITSLVFFALPNLFFTAYSRVLRTPTEEIWPGVSELPDFKASFPKWSDSTLNKQVPRLADDPEGLDILNSMLEYSPTLRINAKAALAHPFFDDFDKSGLPAFDNNVA